MTTRPDTRLTPEEYLRIERAAEWKSEYDLTSLGCRLRVAEVYANVELEERETPAAPS